jgi:uncharacterized membrane protein
MPVHARAQTTAAGRSDAPRWPWLAGLALCGVGFAVASYLTYEHYTASTTLSCPAGGGIVNCFKVTTSSYSKIGGIPVAVLGLVFFAVMAVFQSPPAWHNNGLVLRVARLGWALVGVGTAVSLIYAELFKLDAICLWCTSVHVISLILFALTAVATAVTAPAVPDDEDEDQDQATFSASVTREPTRKGPSRSASSG